MDERRFRDRHFEVSGLATLEIMNEEHVVAGIASGVVDTIPIRFAILSTDPPVDQFQWLLVTLTAGVGGSLLSIGSAAGVALMGQSKGAYTFFGHLKWSWVIALGYAASIAAHFLVNGSLAD